jgi:hypothetical protein
MYLCHPGAVRKLFHDCLVDQLGLAIVRADYAFLLLCLLACIRHQLALLWEADLSLVVVCCQQFLQHLYSLPALSCQER